MTSTMSVSREHSAYCGVLPTTGTSSPTGLARLASFPSLLNVPHLRAARTLSQGPPSPLPASSEDASPRSTHATTTYTEADQPGLYSPTMPAHLLSPFSPFGPAVTTAKTNAHPSNNNNGFPAKGSAAPRTWTSQPPLGVPYLAASDAAAVAAARRKVEALAGATAQASAGRRAAGETFARSAFAAFTRAANTVAAHVEATLAAERRLLEEQRLASLQSQPTSTVASPAQEVLVLPAHHRDVSSGVSGSRDAFTLGDGPDADRPLPTPDLTTPRSLAGSLSRSNSGPIMGRSLLPQPQPPQRGRSPRGASTAGSYAASLRTSGFVASTSSLRASPQQHHQQPQQPQQRSPSTASLVGAFDGSGSSGQPKSPFGLTQEEVRRRIRSMYAGIGSRDSFTCSDDDEEGRDEGSVVDDDDYDEYYD